MDQKDEVKSKVDLVEIVSSYLPLKKMGRNFAGLCPFHSEKTPSFMISAERQVFKCFGCSESGDVFTFLEKMEGWEFREALEELAKRVGVKLKKLAPGGQFLQKERLIEINKLVSKFYSYILEKHELGEKAREYLKKRGIKDSTWQKFGVGFAPMGWENTFNFLKKRGFAAADIAQNGLIIARSTSLRPRGSDPMGSGQVRQAPSDQQFYDRFRNRLMFPLRDSRGTILGFAGRLIEEGSSSKDKGSNQEAPLRRVKLDFAGQAKYINSPQTPIFNKGNLLFGLDVARNAIRGKNEVVLVEGEFDVMSAHQAGVENVVASKGTALTEKQVVALSRICENVALCFDTDLAGDAAARRGIGLLDVAGLQVKVVALGKYSPPRTASSGDLYLSETKYKDPDEFARTDPKSFKAAIKTAENIYDYFIESTIKRFDAKTAEGKKKIGSEIIPILSEISDDLVRAHYIDKLSKVLDLDVNLVAGAVEKKLASDFASFEITPSQSLSKSLDVEKYFLALIFFQDEASKQVISFLKDSDFGDDNVRAFWKWAREAIGRLKNPKIKQILVKLPSKFSKLVDELYLVNISPVFADRELWAAEIAKIAGRVKKNSFKRKLAAVSREIRQAEREKKLDKIEKLTRKFDEMSKSIKEVV